MSDSTFDATKNYKKIRYRADRDLLNTELNEAQDIEAHERRRLLDRVFAQGTIISGLAGEVDGGSVIIADGIVYLDGYAVNVPGGALSFAEPGEHLIYVDVFRREVGASEDPALVNPLTGEPTAEREKWIATLQARDTSGDPLPEGALDRTVVPIYVFNCDTGELRPYAGFAGSGGDIISAFANHIGHGGLDRHPAVSADVAGFMTSEQVGTLADHDARIDAAESDISALQATDVSHDSRLVDIENTLPSKADNTDVAAVSDALDAHKGSSDHDSRYYPKTESDDRFAPKSHVGSAGVAQHPAATGSAAGFMSASDKTQLGDHETRVASIEATLPNKADVSDVNAVSNALNTHKSSSDHDARYYTKSQTDTALAGKADNADVTAVSNALSTHKTSADHDARYFTETESDNRFAPKSHVGSGGTAHPAATTSVAGFMSGADRTQLGDHESRLDTVEAALPGKADDADVTAVSNALNTHNTSADHDGRYYTESESDGRFAPIGHVGSAGSAHGLATVSQAGFMPKEVSAFLSGLIHWSGSYDYGNDGIGALPYGMISCASGMIWRGRCDSSSSHRISAMLRATSSPITAVFELYHLIGTVSMETGSRVQLADPAYHPSTVPGGKVYYVQLYPDSFTYFCILASGSGEVGLSVSIFPGDDRQICYELDPNRSGKPISS